MALQTVLSNKWKEQQWSICIYNRALFCFFFCWCVFFFETIGCGRRDAHRPLTGTLRRRPVKIYIIIKLSTVAH